MKLRHKFLLFAIVIHAVVVGLSLLLLSVSKYLFAAAELLIIVSLIVTTSLYRAFLKPLNLLAAGAESMKDRDFSTTFARTGQHELDRLIEVYNGMIEQLRTERIRQQEQHYFLERLITATPSGVVILDLDENVSLLNPAAAEILGIDAATAIGSPLAEIAASPWRDLVTLAPGETRVITNGGIQAFRCRKSHFVDRGFHRRFILIEELTRELIQSQKRAYGKVIRMMSHEINNSVGAVNSILNSSLAYGDQLAPDDRRDFEQSIRVAIDRNDGLNRFMANFADVVRIPGPNMTRCDLHEVLRSVEVLWHRQCDSNNITWTWDLCASPLTIEAVVQQMEQVLVNIIKNAVEAIGKDGAVTVRTSDDDRPTLTIIDTGRGISEEQRGHLFTPFYSTKKNGQGIGLTVIREILLNHGFRFSLETIRPGQTEFRIDFR